MTQDQHTKLTSIYVQLETISMDLARLRKLPDFSSGTRHALDSALHYAVTCRDRVFITLYEKVSGEQPPTKEL